MRNCRKPAYVEKILIREQAIEREIKKAGVWLTKKFANVKKPPIILGILKGAIPFYGKLVMNLNFECQFEFLVLSSYGQKLEAVGSPKFVTRLEKSIRGRDVVIVEDVIDTAHTISKLYKYLKSKKPRSLSTVVLVDKYEMRQEKYKVDYACFKLPGNPFIIGYGLDAKELGRNLTYIASFKKNYTDKL